MFSTLDGTRTTHYIIALSVAFVRRNVTLRPVIVQSVSPSWCPAPPGVRDQILFFICNAEVRLGAHSLTRVWVCPVS